MDVRIYSVHIEAYSDEDGWTNWDVVNIALTNYSDSAPEAMARGLETCKEMGETLPSGKKPETLRVHEVRFIAEGHT